jgi:hypothetical protein
MAGPFHTYTQLRQAEDVQDEIYIISPIDNPVCSMSRTIRATGKLHEWTEDALAAAAANKAIEGADYPGDQSSPVVELSNHCQIMTKGAEITGTLEDVEKYGRDSEMAYQLELRYGELANDEEYAVMGLRQAGAAGAAGVAREMESLYTQFDASVVTDGAAYLTIPELEAGILSMHLACYSAGGNPSYLFTDPTRAQHIAQFAYVAGRQRDIRNESQLINVIELYKSYYGELDVVLDRNQDDAMYGLDFNYLATPVLRPTRDWPIARTGDSDKRQILRESTIALLNTKSGFAVDNVPASLTLS